MQKARHFVRIAYVQKKSIILIILSTFLQTLISNNLQLQYNLLLFVCFFPQSVGQLREQHDSHKIKHLHHLLKRAKIFAWSP